jgi:hypothetical protein
VIDWWGVLANLLWILGCATALAVLSYTDWHVLIQGYGQRETIKRTLRNPGFAIGMLLICLGAGLGTLHRLGRILWFVLAACLALQTSWAWLYSRKGTSR